MSTLAGWSRTTSTSTPPAGDGVTEGERMRVLSNIRDINQTGSRGDRRRRARHVPGAMAPSAPARRRPRRRGSRRCGGRTSRSRWMWSRVRSGQGGGGAPARRAENGDGFPTARPPPRARRSVASSHLRPRRPRRCPARPALRGGPSTAASTSASVPPALARNAAPRYRRPSDCAASASAPLPSARRNVGHCDSAGHDGIQRTSTGATSAGSRHHGRGRRPNRRCGGAAPRPASTTRPAAVAVGGATAPQAGTGAADGGAGSSDPGRRREGGGGAAAGGSNAPRRRNGRRRRRTRPTPSPRRAPRRARSARRPARPRHGAAAMRQRHGAAAQPAAACARGEAAAPTATAAALCTARPRHSQARRRWPGGRRGHAPEERAPLQSPRRM